MLFPSPLHSTCTNTLSYDHRSHLRRSFFFFFKQKTAYEIGVRLVGSEMCIRDRPCPDSFFQNVWTIFPIHQNRIHLYSALPYLSTSEHTIFNSLWLSFISNTDTMSNTFAPYRIFILLSMPVSYTHLRAHETDSYLVCRLLLEKKKKTKQSRQKTKKKRNSR